MVSVIERKNNCLAGDESEEPKKTKTETKKERERWKLGIMDKHHTQVYVYVRTDN